MPGRWICVPVICCKESCQLCASLWGSTIAWEMIIAELAKFGSGERAGLMNSAGGSFGKAMSGSSINNVIARCFIRVPWSSCKSILKCIERDIAKGEQESRRRMSYRSRSRPRVWRLQASQYQGRTQVLLTYLYIHQIQSENATRSSFCRYLGIFIMWRYVDRNPGRQFEEAARGACPDIVGTSRGPRRSASKAPRSPTSQLTFTVQVVFNHINDGRSDPKDSCDSEFLLTCNHKDWHRSFTAVGATATARPFRPPTRSCLRYR